jgi:hypothetical protein
MPIHHGRKVGAGMNDTEGAASRMKGTRREWEMEGARRSGYSVENANEMWKDIVGKKRELTEGRGGEARAYGEGDHAASENEWGKTIQSLSSLSKSFRTYCVSLNQFWILVFLVKN